MASVANLVRNINLYIDGTQYAGQLSSVTPPDLALVIDEYRGGGMDMPIPVDRGMEMMSAELVLRSYDANAINKFGIKNSAVVNYTVKAALEDTAGVVVPVVMEMRGRITNVSRSPFEGQGEVPETTISLGLTYYKETINSVDEIEIDPVNFKRVISGVDQLADIRAAVT